MKRKKTRRFPPFFGNLSLPCYFLKFGISKKKIQKIQKYIITTQFEKIPWYCHVWRNLIESNKLLSTFYHHFLVLFISTFLFGLVWVGGRGGKQKGQMKRKHEDVEKNNPRIFYPYNKAIFPCVNKGIQIQVPTSKYLIFQNIYVIGTIYLFGNGLERMSLIILFKKKAGVTWWPCHEFFKIFKHIPNERHIFIYIRNI